MKLPRPFTLEAIAAVKGNTLQFKDKPLLFVFDKITGLKYLISLVQDDDLLRWMKCNKFCIFAVPTLNYWNMSKNIIVVDDDEDILNIIELILVEAGYHVRAVSDIVSFYNIHEFKPDLILLDDWLADGYGSKLCLDLKQNPRTSNIPVILISAKNDLPDISKNCLADDFISKPFDLDFFTAKINNWLLKALPK